MKTSHRAFETHRILLLIALAAILGACQAVPPKPAQWPQVTCGPTECYEIDLAEPNQR